MPCIESIMAVVRTINFQLRFNPQRTESFDERCLLREGPLDPKHIWGYNFRNIKFFTMIFVE